MRAFAGVNEPDLVYHNIVLDEEIKVDSYRRLVCMGYWNEVNVPFLAYESMTTSGGMTVENSREGSIVPDYS